MLTLPRATADPDDDTGPSLQDCEARRIAAVARAEAAATVLVEALADAERACLAIAAAAGRAGTPTPLVLGQHAVLGRLGDRLAALLRAAGYANRLGSIAVRATGIGARGWAEAEAAIGRGALDEIRRAG